MTIIGGVYTPDVNRIVQTGAGNTIIQVPTNGQPVNILSASLASTSGNASLAIEIGDWDGVTFTPTQEIGFIAIQNNQTATQWILLNVNGGTT